MSHEISSNIDTIKLKIRKNVYLELIVYLQNNKKTPKGDYYTVNNSIKISRIQNKFTHINCYGLKTYNKAFDDKNAILLKKLIEFLHIYNLLPFTFISKIDIAIDFLHMHPSELYLYNTYTDKNNKKVRLHKLKTKNEYDFKSVYTLDFNYYKANIYSLDVLSNEFYGLPNFKKLKEHYRKSYIEYITTNKIEYSDVGISRFTLKSYFKENLEFVKYENKNYYLYIPKKLYESIEYQSVKDNLKHLNLKFKPSTSKSYTILYDKQNKNNNARHFTKILNYNISRVEFVINFKDYEYLITDMFNIKKGIQKRLNNIFVSTTLIKQRTYKAFVNEYNKEPLLNNSIKDKSINLIDILKN